MDQLGCMLAGAAAPAASTALPSGCGAKAAAAAVAADVALRGVPERGVRPGYHCHAGTVPRQIR